MEKSKKTAMIVAYLCFFVIGMIIGVLTSATVGIIIIFGGGVVAYFFIEMYFDKKKNQVMSCVSFASGKGSPTLKKRCPTSAKEFSIRPLYNHDFDYHPATATFTSVTVGGVTTGGIDVTKEHYSSKTTGRSGKYALFSVEENFEICRIILDDRLLNDAKSNSFIKGFLQGNELVLEHENEDTKLSSGAMENLKGYIKSGNVISQNLQMQDIINAKKLTKEECEKILAWISGE